MKFLYIRAKINKAKDIFFGLMRRYKLYGKIFRIQQVSLNLDDLISNHNHLEKVNKPAYEFFTTVDIKKARTLVSPIGFHIEHNPIVTFLSSSQVNNTTPNYLELKQYYANEVVAKNTSLKSWGQLIGISDSIYDTLPVWVAVFPWEDLNQDVSQVIQLKNFSTFIENAKRGKGIDAINGGSQTCIQSLERVDLEIKLVSKLYQSFQKYGFSERQNAKDPIGGVLLVDNDNNYVWLIQGGIHRIVVLRGLNLVNEINILVKDIVFRNQVSNWPLVKNNQISKEQALKVFDAIFNGDKLSINK